MKRYALIAAVLVLPAAADAHALLRHASPAAGATVREAPLMLTITFSEGVEPTFCSVTVVGADGKHFEQGKPHLVGGVATQMGEDLLPMPPGVYAVTWHATSIDTHKTQGSWQFTVAP